MLLSQAEHLTLQMLTFHIRLQDYSQLESQSAYNIYQSLSRLLRSSTLQNVTVICLGTMPFNRAKQVITDKLFFCEGECELTVVEGNCL